MAIVTRVAGNDIINPVVQLMREVIDEEILQIEPSRMEILLQDIGLLRYQLKAPAENVKIWLQLLHNCVAEAKPLIHRSGSRQRCLDSVTRNPRRFSKQVSQWKALFNHVFQGFETELFHHIVLSRDAINSHVVGPIIPMLNHVIEKEDERQILHADFRPMESLLQDMTTLFRDESNITMLTSSQLLQTSNIITMSTFFQPQQKAPLLTFLQLLQTCLAMARRLLDRPEPRRKGCLDSVVHNPRKLISKEIREWNAFYDEVYHAFQSNMSMLVTSLHFLSTKPLYKEHALLQGVAASGFVGSGIVDAEAQVERWLNQGDRPHLIGVYGMPGIGKTSLLQMVYHKYKKVSTNAFQKVIWVTIPEDYTMFDLQVAIHIQLDYLIILPRNFDERKMVLSAYLKEMNFLLVLDDLWSRIDLQELGVAFGEGKHSKVLFSTRRKELIGEMGAEESIEMQPLSRDEAWMLFRRVAFKDDQVPVDIQERAVRFAEECKGVPLGINIVAAMIGQTSVDEWDACFSLKNNVDPSFPATHPRLDAQLYTLLRWSYDALPHSDVKNCFLYCAMYKEDEKIDSRQLVEMWVGEGLVKSKEGTHLMDMAIGRNYLKLLIDRCLFQIVRQSNNVFRRNLAGDVHDVFPSIRVHHGHIHDMAVYIAEKEENFLLMGSQNVRNFPEAGALYENCTRMSMTIGDLPTDLRCPKLTTLILKDDTDLEELDTDLEELPSGFLLSLTSLRVLNLSGCTNITTSLPTVLGQLTLLQFLSLSDFPIPEEIGHLSNLQFLDLSCCGDLNSLPSQIGQLRNLKHLNLQYCTSLKMIPREISELTSLSRLLLSSKTALSVEMEAAASIWSLKGLRSLTELDVVIDTKQPDGKSSRINDGIMGSWSEMRHLALNYKDNESSEEDLLPEDMQMMKKLQSFMLHGYEGLSLWNCKFEHLEMVYLSGCKRITALSPLEQMPNLKLLKLEECDNLRELGIGSPSGYLSLQKLVLKFLPNLESLGGGPSKRGVWDERTLSQLRVLKIFECPSLRRFPRGMETLPNLCALIYQPWYSSHISAMEWWKSITWEDDNSKVKLQQIFIARDPKF